jgi:hypothetical protein
MTAVLGPPGFNTWGDDSRDIGAIGLFPGPQTRIPAYYDETQKMMRAMGAPINQRTTPLAQGGPQAVPDYRGKQSAESGLTLEPLLGNTTTAEAIRAATVGSDPLGSGEAVVPEATMDESGPKPIPDATIDIESGNVVAAETGGLKGATMTRQETVETLESLVEMLKNAESTFQPVVDAQGQVDEGATSQAYDELIAKANEVKALRSVARQRELTPEEKAVVGALYSSIAGGVSAAVSSAAEDREIERQRPGAEVRAARAEAERAEATRSRAAADAQQAEREELGLDREMARLHVEEARLRAEVDYINRVYNPRDPDLLRKRDLQRRLLEIQGLLATSTADMAAVGAQKNAVRAARGQAGMLEGQAIQDRDAALRAEAGVAPRAPVAADQGGRFLGSRDTVPDRRRRMLDAQANLTAMTPSLDRIGRENVAGLDRVGRAVTDARDAVTAAVAATTAAVGDARDAVRAGSRDNVAGLDRVGRAVAATTAAVGDARDAVTAGSRENVAGLERLGRALADAQRQSPADAQMADAQMAEVRALADRAVDQIRANQREDLDLVREYGRQQGNNLGRALREEIRTAREEIWKDIHVHSVSAADHLRSHFGELSNDIAGVAGQLESRSEASSSESAALQRQVADLAGGINAVRSGLTAILRPSAERQQQAFLSLRGPGGQFADRDERIDMQQRALRELDRR